MQFDGSKLSNRQLSVESGACAKFENRTATPFPTTKYNLKLILYTL